MKLMNKKELLVWINHQIDFPPMRGWEEYDKGFINACEEIKGLYYGTDND